MKKILFVDDQPEILRGLKRALRTINLEWDTEFVTGGDEALELMSKKSFDVIVSDMRMPKMNGVELLNIVMERYPETVRIILSGHSDKEMIMDSLNCSHQFLVKPCNPEKISYTIERACRLYNLLSDKSLIKIVTGIKSLPSLPSLYSMIVKEMQSPDTSIKKVANIISQDVSMSAKVLQIVNSAYFGLPQKITDSQQAAVYLGVETLKSLVLSVNVFSSFEEGTELYGQPLQEIWKHSMMTGKIAKEIAIIDRADGKVAEQALIAGMLHEIGKLVLLKAPDQYSKVKNIIKDTGFDSTRAEYTAMKISHVELGAYLLGIWGLPDSIVETVAYHHHPLELVKGALAMKDQSIKNVDQIKHDDDSTNLQSSDKHSMDFAVLTYVHVANALMMQKNCSADTTDFPYIDMVYLKAFNLTDRLPEWVECYNKVKQEGSFQ